MVYNSHNYQYNALSYLLCLIWWTYYDWINMTIDGCTIQSNSTVRNLGVSFEPHIRNVTKLAIFHFKNSSISLIDPTSETLIDLLSCLDYCNITLYRLPAKTLNRCQHIQTSAAQVLTRHLKCLSFSRRSYPERQCSECIHFHILFVLVPHRNRTNNPHVASAMLNLLRHIGTDLGTT